MLAHLFTGPRFKTHAIASSFLSVFFCSFSVAQVTVSPIFNANMILQRGTTVPVFGSAPPGTTVTVQFLSQSVSAVANSTGKWQANLSAMTANATPTTLTVSSGAGVIAIPGVQVGEVWLCSGQSNMGFPLNNANNSASAISSAGNHNIRLFRMTAGNGPGTTSWQVANSATVPNFSAVGYWMGLELSQSFTNVPVGLIQATHDGTSIDHWQHSSSGIGDDYDAMVKSIQPFAVKGVAWYQGESNGGDAAYAGKLTNMIREWRGDWNLPELPFGIIQLAYRSGWNVCRNAQLEVSETEPACFLVVIRDLPGGSLHPSEKKPVGIRTAIGARGKVYGESIVYSGPVRDIISSYASGNKVILKWKFPGTGIFTNDGKVPGGFSLAAATGQFKAATAVIVGNTIEVTSSIVNPTRVQYAYSSVGNLYNRVSVPTEGGTVIVDKLKASEFQISVAPLATARIPTAVQGITEEENLAGIFPMPATSGTFTLQFAKLPPEKQINIVMVDANGKTVFMANKTTARQLTIDSQLQPGVYFVRASAGGRRLLNQKVVIGN